MRIVGGQFRGRRLQYTGDWRVRPMKDRTREAVFNLLGPAVQDMLVVDLFAGTGAMALEALSRGAAKAVMIERHLPTAAVIERNVAELQLQDCVEVVRADAFHWGRQQAAQLRDGTTRDGTTTGERPWLVFCCPPYSFFLTQLAALHELLNSLRAAAPANSALVVEAEVPFDFTTLWSGDWTIRDYSPATIGIFWTEVEPAVDG